jgi:hypothetical protein
MNLDITGVGAVAGFLGKIVDKIFPDAGQADKIKAELILAQQSGDLQLALGQLAINKAEADSTNWFVAGWRPYIGWVCGTGLAYSFLIFPLLHVLLPSLQSLDANTLLTCLGGLLGMGSLRTVEKIKDVAR